MLLLYVFTNVLENATARCKRHIAFAQLFICYSQYFRAPVSVTLSDIIGTVVQS